MQVRLDKRARIIADGGQAYPVDLLRDHTLVQVRQKYTDDTGELTLAPGEETTDEVTVGGNPITVGAIGEDLAFSHSPVLWVPTDFWKEVMHTDADGTVLLSDHEVDGSVPLKESFSGLPAYSSEQGSLKLIQGFLYGISALVTIAFLSVWTIQRTRDIAGVGAYVCCLTVDVHRDLLLGGQGSARATDQCGTGDGAGNCALGGVGLLVNPLDLTGHALPHDGALLNHC